MRTRFLGGAVCALIALALGAPAAQAGQVAQAACAPQAATQAFLPFGDRAFYAPVPGGTFESGVAGWTLAGRASFAADNEPFFIGAPTDRRSLQLAGGASAVSPVMCAGTGYPYARAFARRIAGSGSLRVDVLSVNRYGVTLTTTPAGLIAAQATWAPTRRFSAAAGLSAHLGGQIRLRITAPLGSTWRVDDVQLDPRLSR